jgi:flagellar hook assembly protein FlgD
VLGSPASVETKTHVDIAVFNVLGQRIATIYSRNRYGGLEPYTWDGCDRDGSPVPPGVYFIRIVAGDKNTVRKVVVIR